MSEDDDSPLLGSESDHLLGEENFISDQNIELNNNDHGRTLLLQRKGVRSGARLYQIKTNYESLDYEITKTTVGAIDQKKAYRKSSRTIEVERWFCCFLIGLFTGLTGIIITVAIEILAHFKRQLLNWLFNSESGQTHVHTAIPVITWTGMNFVLVFIAGLLCSYISPVAAGSGIPQIKCFLNGVKVPKVIRLKTYLVKTVGIVLAVVGGLACGKEGPMVHAGAVIAGGISQGSDIFLLMNFYNENMSKQRP